MKTFGRSMGDGVNVWKKHGRWSRSNTPAAKGVGGFSTNFDEFWKPGGAKVEVGEPRMEIGWPLADLSPVVDH